MSQALADRYRQMPDERLLQIALHEAAGLTPEAQAVLHAELESRGADPVVGRAVEAQTRTRTAREVEALVAAIRAQPCPECGQADRPLNGGEIAMAKSYILMSTTNRHTAIACPDCLARQARRAAITTAILGWWGLPFGPIYTIGALRRSLRTLRQRHDDHASDALRVFVEQNPGVATSLASGA